MRMTAIFQNGKIPNAGNHAKEPTSATLDVHLNPEIKESRESLGENPGKMKLVIYGLGIFVCYFYYGILQEKITKGNYGEGDKKERYTYTLALVFVQCIINSLFVYILSKFTVSVKDDTPTKYFAICSLTYLGAMVASNHSLQYVSYPTQVLGKSAKPIPVMILGVLLAQKRYPAVKYLCVLIIVLGVSLFLYKDKGGSKADVSKSAFGFGEILLLLSLTMDGLTGATQDTMKNLHKTGAWPMMFHMNVWSLLWLFIALVVTGEGVEFVLFVHRFPYVMVHLITFSLASAVGQSFIFLTVTTFGPLTCSVITTTRKFFTILTSVIFFNNPMSSRQWVGTALVFSGLGLDAVFGRAKKKETK